MSGLDAVRDSGHKMPGALEAPPYLALDGQVRDTAEDPGDPRTLTGALELARRHAAHLGRELAELADTLAPILTPPPGPPDLEADRPFEPGTPAALDQAHRLLEQLARLRDDVAVLVDRSNRIGPTP